MRDWIKQHKQLTIGAILIIALFVILFFTGIIKFGWQNDTSKSDYKNLENEITLLNSKLTNETAFRKYNYSKIIQFEGSINYLDVRLAQKDKEIQDLNIKYDKKIKDIDNLSTLGLSKYFTNRYGK